MNSRHDFASVGRAPAIESLVTRLKCLSTFNEIIASHSPINLRRPTVVFEIHLDGKLSSLSHWKIIFPLLPSSRQHFTSAKGEDYQVASCIFSPHIRLLRFFLSSVSRWYLKEMQISTSTKNFIMRSLLSTGKLHEVNPGKATARWIFHNWIYWFACLMLRQSFVNLPEELFVARCDIFFLPPPLYPSNNLRRFTFADKGSFAALLLKTMLEDVNFEGSNSKLVSERTKLFVHAASAQFCWRCNYALHDEHSKSFMRSW